MSNLNQESNETEVEICGNKGTILYQDNTPESPVNTDFVPCGSGVPNKEFHKIQNSPVQNKISVDIKSLSATELKNKYSPEYNSWANMKQRKNKGAVIHPEFEKFPDFLKHMGERPDENYTLDRIDNNDPSYGPNNCRWADKYTQNNNKGNNVYLTHEDGICRTIAQWAALTNQNSSTLYKRREAGWDDMEIITGVRKDPVSDPWAGTPWPKDNKENWEKEFQKHVFKGGNEDRLEFFASTAKNQFDRFKNEAKEFGEYQGEPIPPNLIANIKKWEQLAKNAKEQLDYSNNRKEFINRKSTLSKHQEAVLFDMFNKPPVIE